MQVSFELPKDIARVLASTGVPLDRAALESLAAEAYRNESSRSYRRCVCCTFPRVSPFTADYANAGPHIFKPTLTRVFGRQ